MTTLLKIKAPELQPQSRKTAVPRPERLMARDRPGFQRRFSCGCWPMMVRIIWWALRTRD